MNHDFSFRQKSIAKLARDFAQNELAPNYSQRDSRYLLNRGLYNKAADLGLCGIPWPEQYGGMGADYISYILACEELCQVDDGLGFSVAATCMLFGWPVFTYGSEEQKQKWLTPTNKHNKMGAFCLSEPAAGSDISNLRTTALKQGESYIINGCKAFVSNGGEADYYLIIAATKYGLSAFVAEKNTPGLGFGPPEYKLGSRTLPTCKVFMKDLILSQNNLLGREGQGMEILANTVHGGRFSVAALALGLCRAALRHSLDYAKKKTSPGQATQFMLADMATLTEALALMVYRVGWLRDNGHIGGLEASYAKLFGAKISALVTSQAIDILGNYGCCEDYPVERLLRGSRMTGLAGGTTQTQQMIIARNLLADRSKT